MNDHRRPPEASKELTERTIDDEPVIDPVSRYKALSEARRREERAQRKLGEF